VRKYLLLIVMSVVMVASAQSPRITIIPDQDIPHLDHDEASEEEQAMLAAFQVPETSPFWQWVYKMSGVIVAHCTNAKRTVHAKYHGLKIWWFASRYKNSANKNRLRK
jgi:hypothetical protein